MTRTDENIIEKSVESEQRWATTLASIGDAVIATDKSGKITLMNGVAEKLTGWTLNEASKKDVKTVFNIVNEETRLPVENPIINVLKEGVIVGLANHTVLIQKQGSEVPIDDSGAPIKGKDGKIIGVVLVFRDITERKKSQEALRDSEEKYRLLLQYAPTAIYEIDFTGPRFTNVNDAMCVMTGCSREELLATNPFDFLEGESLERFNQRIRKASAGEKIDQNVEYKAIAKGGRQLWVTLNMKFMRQNGKIYGAQVVAHDVTERKKAEASVKAERKRLFDVLETVPIMVCLLSPDYHVVFANRSFREKFSGSNGRHCYEYCFGSPEPCKFCESYVPLKTGKPHQWEVTGLDGTTIDAYDFPFIDVDGSSLILEMDIDITPRKRAEAEAQESAKKLKDSERLAAIGATAGMVGHDIRNPLQAITGDLYLAKEELASLPASNEKNNTLESLTEIEKNIDYINKIVADLQDFARPLKPHAEEADFKSIIDELLSKNGLPENIKVNVNVDSEAGKIVADSSYINRILYNLVTNAVQAMPKGGQLTIQTFRDKETKVVVLTVEDTGVGIPENAKDKLFTPMFTTKSKGQGFGLAVVKRMTESLGGTVSFESQEGQGTKFIVRFAPVTNYPNKI